MLFKWAIRGSVAVLSFGVFGPAEGAEGKIGGLAFGDCYFVATGANKHENGFKFRRIYMTYDLEWNDRWSGRVRYEANDSGFGVEDKMRRLEPSRQSRSRDRPTGEISTPSPAGTQT